MKQVRCKTQSQKYRRHVVSSAREQIMSEPIDFKSAVFNPLADEITNTWSSRASQVICVNAYPNGITVSLHNNHKVLGEFEKSSASESDLHAWPAQFHLRLKDMRDYNMAPGRYFLYKESYRESLEGILSRLHKQGKLSSTVIYFGTTHDAFFAFHKKFPITMTCLQLFEKYAPAKVVVQTRSPMVIAALPMLKALGSSAVVVIPIETISESAVARFTPGAAKISERLMAADGLRAQGIEVNLSASPMLPYGDMQSKAVEFATTLARHSDYVTFGSFTSGDSADENVLKRIETVRRLVEAREYKMLRPYSWRYVYYALKTIAPEKLALPLDDIHGHGAVQLSIFAA